MPGQPDLVDLLARDVAFANAVAARSPRDAAAAALAAIRSNWRTYGHALRPAHLPPPSGLPPHDLGSPGAPRRHSEPSGSLPPQHGLGAGAAGAAPAAPAGGGVAGMGLGGGGSAGGAGGAGLMRQGSRGGGLDRQGSLFRTRAPLKLKDFVKLMRKELAAAEEQVPWSLVENRWRAQRKNWQRRVRQADSIQGLAGCVWELHGTLRTDKASGLFASGGQWERSLLQVVNGLGNQLQLQTVWEEMRGALQAWLEKQQLPGSSASLDKASYAQAVRTYNVLQEAAQRGPEYLDQVPLDQILGSQRELQALQAIILREHAALQARLHETATGTEGANGASAAAMAIMGDPSAGQESMLASIGKLPSVRGAEEDEVDTDADGCSEATDMDDSE